MFETPIGTFSNASGLPQVPAGSTQIPQSLLNGVGRQIDKARIAPSQGVLLTQTPGGTSIDFATLLAQAQASAGMRLPFTVEAIGVTPTGIQCRIAEGRIFGRVEWVGGKYYPGLPSPGSFVKSLGIAGFDAAEWPGPASPSDSPEENPKDPSQAEQVDGASGNSSGVKNNSGTYHTPLPVSGNGSYVSGNAGSFTRPGSSSGTYHSPLATTGSGSYQSGNAGSVTGLGNGGGVYHNQFSVTGNGSYQSGNAGSATRPGMSSGTYHTPTTNGNTATH